MFSQIMLITQTKFNSAQNCSYSNKSSASFGSNYHYTVTHSNVKTCNKLEDILYTKENTDFGIEEEFARNWDAPEIKTVHIFADDKYDEFIESLMLQNNIPFKKTSKKQALDLSNIYNRLVLPDIYNKNQYSLVSIDVDKFDKLFQDNYGYIGKNGEGGIFNRYQTFMEYLKTGKDIEASRIFATEENGQLTISFLDGRHRYSVMRDMGMKSIKFAVDKNTENLLRKYGFCTS